MGNALQTAGNSGISSSPIDATFPNPTKSGNFLYVVYFVDDINTSTPVITDPTFGNTFQTAQALVSAGGGSRVGAVYAENMVGGASHAIRLSVTNFTHSLILVAEYPGVKLSSSKDGSSPYAPGGLGTTGYTSGQGTVVFKDLLIGFANCIQSGSVTVPDSPWVADAHQDDGLVFYGLNIQSAIVSPGNYNCTGTCPSDVVASGFSAFRLQARGEIATKTMRPRMFRPGNSR